MAEDRCGPDWFSGLPGYAAGPRTALYSPTVALCTEIPAPPLLRRQWMVLESHDAGSCAAASVSDLVDPHSDFLTSTLKPKHDGTADGREKDARIPTRLERRLCSKLISIVNCQPDRGLRGISPLNTVSLVGWNVDE